MPKEKKNLVIVESPAKARTLEKFLGKDFMVEACGGHIRDLPKSKLGVDVKHNYEPTYVTIKGKEKIIKHLVAVAKKAEKIYLAPDPDREGEAIAWHLTNYLGKDSRIKRIEFNEITRQAVLEAVKNPREIDMDRVNAQQARRILDRLVGYKISPILWKKIRRGLSAGRVQSIALRFICEREREVQKFKSEEYWTIAAKLKKEEAGFPAKLLFKGKEKIVIPNEKEATKIAQETEGQDFVVEKVSKRERRRNPAPPFITSTLQQEAARKLGFSARRTMMVAQKLYEGIDLGGEERTGLITYMRTDSVRIADIALKEVREYIDREHGAHYMPKSPRRYHKKKQAQDAHEAIRPTMVFRHPEKIRAKLTPEQFKLYLLIWQRFVASQMEPAVLDLTAIDMRAGEYLFRANGAVIKFDGFTSLYEEGKDEAPTKPGTEDEEEKQLLPDLVEGEQVALEKLEKDQHFTEPPPCYTEASLVKILEQKGIGRPSTYAPIIATILQRRYVGRDGKKLRPTDLGILINDQLTKHFPRVMDIKFTAHMEDGLDNIVGGEAKWTEVLDEFYGPFEKTLKKAETEMKKMKERPSKEICEKCGKPMVIKHGRYGDFLACSGYPKCKSTRDLPQFGETKVEGEETCDKCGRPMVVKRGRYGAFWACSGYPKCKSVKPILKKVGVKCPEKGCDGELVEKRTRKGRIFYACSNYPKCKFASWDKPISEPCPKCGGLLVEKKARGKLLRKCVNVKCEYIGEEKALLPGKAKKS